MYATTFMDMFVTRHSMESREPVEVFLVHGLEGLLAVLRTLFLLYPEKKAATLGRFTPPC